MNDFWLKPTQGHTKDQQKVLRRNKRFVFTQASNPKPQHHDYNEFRQIMDHKKVYQSMIKDGLLKLQYLQTQISQNDVPQLCTINETKKQNMSKNIKEKQVNSVAIRKGQKEIAPIQLDWDHFMQRQIPRKLIDKLMLFRKQNSYRRLKKMIKERKEKLKNERAAKYFYSQNLSKKYFQIWRKYCGEQVDENDKQLRDKVEKVKIILAMRGLKVLKIIIQDRKIRNRKNVFKRTKQYRVKKNSLKVWRNRKISIFSLQQNYCKLETDRFSASFKELLTGLRKNLQINEKIKSLNLLKKKTSLTRFYTQTLPKKTLKEFHLQRIYEKIKEKIGASISFLHSNNFYQLLTEEGVTKLARHMNVTKLKQMYLNEKLGREKYERGGKRLFKSLGQNKIFSTFIESVYQTKKKGVITSFLERLQSQRHIKKSVDFVRKLYIRKYLKVSRQNVKMDMKLSNSIKRCLRGSKQWLMKNKRIFQSQAHPEFLNVQKGGKEVLIAFSHPLYNKSLKELLRTESKFKKWEDKNMKKIMIRRLIQWHQNKRQEIEKVRNANIQHQRYYEGKVLRILKNKQQIKQIKKEVDEEIEEETELELSERVKDLRNFIDLKKKKELVKMMKEHTNIIKSLKSRQSKISDLIEKNKIKGLVISLERRKQQKKIKIELKQRQFHIEVNKKKQKLKQLFGLLSYSRVMERKAKQVCQLNKKLLRVQHQRKCTSFLKLLQLSFRLSHKSVEVTCIYLKGWLFRASKFEQNRKKNRQIQMEQALMEDKVKANKKKCAIYKLKQLFTYKLRNQNLKKLIQNINLTKKRRAIETLINHKNFMERKENIMKFIDTNYRRNTILKLKEVKKKKSLKTTFNNQKSHEGLNDEDDKERYDIGIEKVDESEQKRNQKPQQLNEQSDFFNQYFDNEPHQTLFDRQSSQSEEAANTNEAIEKQESYEEYRSNRKQKKSQSALKQFNNQQQFDQSSTENRNENMNFSSNQKESPNKDQYFNYEQDNQYMENKFKEDDISIRDQQFDHEVGVEEQRQSDSELYNEQYFTNRYKINLCKRLFSQWRYWKQEKQSQNRINREIVIKVFQGLRIYTKQKLLVRKYLQQYENQVHYYPQSRQEYQQFREIIEMN